MTLMVLLLGCPPETPADVCGVTGDDPFIDLLSPEEGDIVCGAPLRVEVCVANLELVAPGDAEDAKPGTGHVDIALNGQDAGMVWDTATDLTDVADGEWQLKVELSNADHTPVQPYTGEVAYITVSALECP